MGSGKYLIRSIKKYGIENFKKEILFIFDNEEKMNLKEKELVTEEFCQRKDTYNICEGGAGGFSYINKFIMSHEKRSEYQKKCYKKIENTMCEKYGHRWRSERAKEFTALRKEKKVGFFSPENIERTRQRNKTASPMLGKKRSESARKKLSLAQSGERNSQYGTTWITNGKENKKIKKEDLDNWLEKGYVKGRKLSTPVA